MADTSRQENAFIFAVTNTVRQYKHPINIQAGDTRISAVEKAVKYRGRQASGSEPYTDIVLSFKTKKPLNLSLKGDDAPSLAGGGARGLEAIVPGITTKFMKTAYDALIRKGFKEGDPIPDVYGKISVDVKTKIVVGKPIMGGPIHYMYIGPMSLKSDYDTKKNVLKFNGQLIDSKTFAATRDLYFRLRRRKDDQVFDPNNYDKKGVPRIYSRSKATNEDYGRVVITDFYTKTGLLVNIR